MTSQTNKMASIDEELKTKFAHDKHRLFANVVFTSNWLSNLVAKFLAPFDLTSPQFNILRILRGAKDWVSMNDIKRLMVEKSPHTTRLVDKLQKKELVERKRSEKDRRVVYVSITQKGLDLLAEIDIKSKESNHMLALDRITDDEANKVNEILTKLRG